MKNRIREYENRYWLQDDDIYELHFTQFYDDEIIFKIYSRSIGFRELHICIKFIECRTWWYISWVDRRRYGAVWGYGSRSYSRTNKLLWWDVR